VPNGTGPLLQLAQKCPDKNWGRYFDTNVFLHHLSAMFWLKELYLETVVMCTELFFITDITKLLFDWRGVNRARNGEKEGQGSYYLSDP